MKKSKKGLPSKNLIYKIIVAILILVILVWVLFHYGIIKKNCETNKACFEERFKECKSAKVTQVINENTYTYTIKRKEGNVCLLKVKLEETGFGTTQDIKDLFEGKEMLCQIPLTKVQKIPFYEFKEILNYCSGPLKEAIYEQMINKLYGLVIQNMGPILSEIEKSIYTV
jgi:hypothetical protein